MAQQLSAKQYIQTRARTLPVYKCLVVKGWAEAKMAQVLVMRRHSNGNITAGIYLVDLLCLGVKDTVYFFNLPEAEIEEKFGDQLYRDFEEIDYNLAHNIVYAGHDFAMEFDIKPHPDFAITKFILAEDNDDIELVDIEVGTDDGKPYLMVRHAGEFSDALAKLKKNAGEGNYYYSVGEPFDDDDDDEYGGEDEDDEDGFGEDVDTAFYNIDEFDLGEITPLQAKFIYTDDLLNEELVLSRSPYEVLNIKTEVALRTLEEVEPGYFEQEDIEDEDNELFENGGYASGLSEEQEDSAAEVQSQITEFYQQEAGNEDKPEFKEKQNTFLTGLLHEHSDNPVTVANIFEYALFVQEKQVADVAEGYLQELSSQYPLAVLTLAFAALIKNEDAPQYAHIYNSETLTAAFPGKTDLSDADLNTYGLLKAVLNLKHGNLKAAIYFYSYAAGTEVFNWMLSLVQATLVDAAGKIIEQYDTDEDDNEAYDNEENGNEGDDDNPPVLRAV